MIKHYHETITKLLTTAQLFFQCPSLNYIEFIIAFQAQLHTKIILKILNELTSAISTWQHFQKETSKN